MPQTKEKLEDAWHQAWRDLPQARINHWIDRIPRHIQKVIELEGGNMYREGYKD